jgi:hypothetical protein
MNSISLSDVTVRRRNILAINCGRGPQTLGQLLITPQLGAAPYWGNGTNSLPGKTKDGFHLLVAVALARK